MSKTDENVTFPADPFQLYHRASVWVILKGSSVHNNYADETNKQVILSTAQIMPTDVGGFYNSIYNEVCVGKICYLEQTVLLETEKALLHFLPSPSFVLLVYSLYHVRLF